MKGLVIAAVLLAFAGTAHAEENEQPTKSQRRMTRWALSQANSAPDAGADSVSPRAAPWAKPHMPLFVRAYGGAARGRALERSVAGPSGGIGLGASVLRRPWGGFDVTADIGYDALDTAYEVGIHRLAFSPSAELKLWRVRLGLGADIGSAWIARVSGSTFSAQTYYVGGHATLGVDLVTIDRFTLYIAARGDLNAYLPSFGGNAGVRVAF